MDSIVVIPIQKYSIAIFFYILYKFDQDWSSKPRDYEGKTSSFWTRWQKSAFRNKYPSKYGTDCHHNISAGKQMYADYTRNAWQSLVYSPLGAVESPIIVNTNDTHLLTDRRLA